MADDCHDVDVEPSNTSEGGPPGMYLCWVLADASGGSSFENEAPFATPSHATGVRCAQKRKNERVLIIYWSR